VVVVCKNHLGGELLQLVANQEEEIGNLQHDSNHHFHTAQEKTKESAHLSSLFANLVLQREADRTREAEIKHQLRLSQQAFDRRLVVIARQEQEINSLREELATKTTKCDFAVRQSRDYAWEIVEEQRRNLVLQQEFQNQG
jgi:redox-regulated HSP33 family molecular chaperone